MIHEFASPIRVLARLVQRDGFLDCRGVEAAGRNQIDDLSHWPALQPAKADLPLTKWNVSFLVQKLPLDQCPKSFAGQIRAHAMFLKRQILAVSSLRFLTLRFLFRFGRGDFLPGWRAPGLPRRTGEDHVPIGTPSGDPV
jgi:hypothetical protein